MRLVNYGMDRLEDAPHTIVVAVKDTAVRVLIPVNDGVGVSVIPGLGVSVMDIFSVNEKWHYRIRRLIPWDLITNIQFDYPPIADVPSEVWEHSREVVDTGEPS